MSQNFFFNNTIVILDEFRGSGVGLQELLMQTAYPNMFVAASLQEWEKHHTLIPDHIICEFGPESCNAENLHHRVMERGWNCKLMVYSSRDRILALPEYVMEKCAAVVCTQDDAKHGVDAVFSVFNGLTYFSPIAKEILVDNPPADRILNTLIWKCNDDDVVILWLMCQGFSAKESTHYIALSQRTIENRKAALKERFTLSIRDLKKKITVREALLARELKRRGFSQLLKLDL